MSSVLSAPPPPKKQLFNPEADTPVYFTVLLPRTHFPFITNSVWDATKAQGPLTTQGRGIFISLRYRSEDLLDDGIKGVVLCFQSQQIVSQQGEHTKNRLLSEL